MSVIIYYTKSATAAAAAEALVAMGTVACGCLIPFLLFSLIFPYGLASRGRYLWNEWRLVTIRTLITAEASERKNLSNLLH